VAQVGFSMHPQWAEAEQAAEFLQPLREVGLGAVEFELDSNDRHWAQFEPLMRECRALGFALCFHGPYRLPRTIAGFAGRQRAEIVASLAPMYDIAAEYGPTTVVIHGAKSADRSQTLLYTDTVAFLRWVLDRYVTLTVALENINPDPAANKVGTNRPDVFQIVQEISHPRLGICWDVGHDVNSGATEPPRDAWLRRVRHVHIHDLDGSGLDHYPLIHGRVKPERWLPPLMEAGFSGIVTLEVSGVRFKSIPPNRILPTLAESVRAISEAMNVEQHAETREDAL
jgi:sugar phosphate isomerase/epimerase